MCKNPNKILDDREADYRIFYEANYSRILRYFRARIFDPDDVVDLTQKVFEICWRRFDEYRENPENELWIIRIAENIQRYELRKKKRRSDIYEHNQPIIDGVGRRGPAGSSQNSPVENELLRKEIHEALADIVNGLPETLRTVFLMRLDGKTYDEIGYVLGISKQGARKRMELALQTAGDSLADLVKY